MSFLGNEALKIPTQQMQSRSTGVGIHRRAYASLEVSGKNPNVKCGGGSITKIESDVSKKHSSMFSTEGGRLTPQPMLDSVSISNDGGQDLSDAMLFQADVKLKCWNKSDFDGIETSFMTPGRRCLIKLGWIGGDVAKIAGDVTGFNFSINADLSFDITIKLGGIMEGILSADFTTLQKEGIEYEDKESGEKVRATDIVSNLVGAHANAEFKPADGKAIAAAGLGRANHQMERSGFFSYFTSNDNVIDYVSLEFLIENINLNAKGKGSTNKDIKFDTSNFTPGTIKRFASANPLKLIVSYKPEDAKYGEKADYSALNNSNGMLSNIWLSLPGLVEIYEGLTNPPGAETERVVSTTSFLKKIFQMIKDFTGGALQPFLYSDPNQDKMIVLNRGTAVKGGSVPVISVANGYKNGIRDITLTSNLDSELMAMATTAAMTGQGGEALQKLYPGCFEKGEVPNINEDYKKAVAALGDTISETDIQQAKQAIKKYVNQNYKQAAPNISYGLDCTLTCDGYTGPTFGQGFTVDRLPNRMKGNGIFFVVTKLGQNFSNGDWTTEITGTMMIDQ